LAIITTEVKTGLCEKVVVKILQSSVGTQTMLGGLSICVFSGCKFPTVNTCQNYENWLAVDKVIVK